MGNGMNKIIPGLFVGNFRDAKDPTQLEENGITHILSIHDNAKKILKDKEYLCLEASDSSDQDLTKFFPQVFKFIHKARLDGGAVLVHCLAGVSRSVTVTAAYIMTVTELGWRDSLNAIRGARSVANPNFGFQKQLQHYDSEQVVEERKRLKRMFPNNPFNDEEECRINLHCYQQYILTGSTPTRSDYPLPYKAYQTKTQEEKEKGSPAFFVPIPRVKRSKNKAKSGSGKERDEEENGNNEDEEAEQSTTAGSTTTETTTITATTTTTSNTSTIDDDVKTKRQGALLDDL